MQGEVRSEELADDGEDDDERERRVICKKFSNAGLRMRSIQRISTSPHLHNNRRGKSAGATLSEFTAWQAPKGGLRRRRSGVPRSAAGWLPAPSLLAAAWPAFDFSGHLSAALLWLFVRITLVVSLNP